MSFLAQVSYTGNGSTTQYSITFPYIDVTHVKAYLDGVLTTAYTISSSTLTFTTAPANGVVIRIERETPNNTRLVDFTDGSVLTESDLDRSADQNFYIAQEITDDSSSKLGLDTDDKYNANNKVIKNLANPVNNNDAVNKTYLENTWLSTSDKANLTTVAGISGAVSTVAGISSEVSAVNSNSSNINTVSGQITPTNNISTLAGINSDITNVANNNADITTVAGQISPTNNISTLAGLDTELSAIYNIRNNITNVDTNSPNVNLVAGQISPTNNISTLANLDTELSAIYAIRNNITNVDTNSTNVNLVAGQISPTNNINTLGNLSSQLTTLGALGTEITNLNNIRTDISGVNAISGQVQTVAGLNTEISNLNTIRTDITAVSNISTDIQDVQNKLTEIQAVANDLNEVTSEIDTVAGSINQIDAVGNDLLGANNIGTVATNLASVQNFAEVYRISATAPSTSLNNGDLWFDTTAGKLKVWSGSSWELAGSSINGTSARYKYTATASQTTFTGADDNGNTLAYDSGFTDVYLNGVKLVNGSDYTATDGSNVVLTTGASVNDILEIIGFGTFSVADFDASGLTGTINIARIADGSITNAKLATPFSLTNPTITSISPSTITNSATNIVITGTNYVITPLVEIISTNGKVYFPNTVTRNSATQLTVNVTIPDDGTYFIRVENPDGLAVRSSTALLTVSDAPTWSTASGSLGSLAQGASFSTTVSATSDSAVNYSYTGTLPTGLTLNSSTGVISGTESSSITQETTYNFTITATDAESQTADRAFSITVTVGINNGAQFN